MTELTHETLPNILDGYRFFLRRPAPNTFYDKPTFWRFGVTHEMYNWLITNVGETAGRIEWQQGQGDWILTGCHELSRHKYSESLIAIVFHFRNKSDALLFKLAWMKV